MGAARFELVRLSHILLFSYSTTHSSNSATSQLNITMARRRPRAVFGSILTRCGMRDI